MLKEINITFTFDIKEDDPNPEETASRLAYKLWCKLLIKEFNPKYYSYSVDEYGVIPERFRNIQE